MVEIDDTTRVLVVPDGVLELALLRIDNGVIKKTIAIAGDQVYEIREMGPPSQYDSRPEPCLPSGGPVKSIILESVESGDQGAVLKNPNVLNCTRFNLIYPTLAWMGVKRDVYASRYHAFDELVDEFANWLQVLPQVLPRGAMNSCVESICDSIVENSELYYKLSSTKMQAFLASKVEALKTKLLANPHFSLTTLIHESLALDGSTQATDEILQLQCHKFSVDFIFGSYLNETLKSEFLQNSGVDYSKLDEFMRNQDLALKARKVVENNRASVANSTNKQKANESSNSKKTKKQPAKKVAIGKGALDSFFKQK